MCVRTNGRDRITNGRLLPGHIDLRSAAARRFRHLISSYVAELGLKPSESQMSLIRQISTLQLQIENLQGAVVGGQTVLSDELIRLSSEHRRLVGALQAGADQNRPTGPSLHDYISQRYGSGDES
jgi:hypothetical protein